jgi:hypothetical protein
MAERSVLHKMLPNFTLTERLVLNILENVYEYEPTEFQKVFFPLIRKYTVSKQVLFQSQINITAAQKEKHGICIQILKWHNI